MTFNNLLTVSKAFPPWIKLVPGRAAPHRPCATVVFPHAGAAAASYRKVAGAFAASRDTYIVQYPQRAERLREPAPENIYDLALGLFEAGPWDGLAPLRLFGHSMGAIVAFEFARIAESRATAVERLWVSAAPAPCAVAAMSTLPTGDDELLADIADLGGTDADLLADAEFAALITGAVRADYEAINRYHCAPGVRIGADISVLGARADHRVDVAALRLWQNHTAGAFELSVYDGGHFYLAEQIDAVAARVNADG